MKRYIKTAFSLLFLIGLNIAATVCLASEIAAGEDYRVRQVKISGNTFFSNRRIRALMETDTKGLVDRILFWRRAPLFGEDQFHRDIYRIERAYQREGFINIEIDTKIDIPTDNRVKIEVIIDEGRRVEIKEINYELIDVSDISEHEEHLNAIKEESELDKGSYFRDEYFKKDIAMINDYYDKVGFPFITTTYSLELDKEAKLVSITINLEPGDRAYLGDIVFQGLERTDEEDLMRAMTIKEGDPYNPQRFISTRDNLQATDLFRFVSVNARLTTSPAAAAVNQAGNTTIPVEIFVREKDNITLDFGIGYGFEENVRVSGEVTKKRFAGGLRTGTFLIRHSAIEPYHLSFKLTQPLFPTRKSNFVFNPFFRREKEAAYRVDRTGFNATINHTISRRTGAFISYGYEDTRLDIKDDDVIFRQTFSPAGYTVNFSKPELEAPETLNQGLEALDTLREGEQTKPADYYRKSSVSLGLHRDTSKPDFFPQKGKLLSNIFTYSGLFQEADYPYLRNMTDLRLYQSLGTSLVAAMRFRIGFISPVSDNEFIPFEERFYAGGAFSVRGWSRRQLGPKNIDDEAIGGKSYFEGSIEIRYPLWRQLSAATFLDYGNVWEDEFAYDITDLRYAAGTGFRYATPAGPLRIDFAVPVFEERRPLQFFLSLGQSF